MFMWDLIIMTIHNLNLLEFNTGRKYYKILLFYLKIDTSERNG